MTDDYDTTPHGEDPRPIALGNCTGCGMSRGFSEGGGLRCENCGKPWPERATPPARIAPDEVTVSRADLQAVLDGCIQQHTNADYVWRECGCCYADTDGGAGLTHDDNCAVKRLTAALAGGA